MHENQADEYYYGSGLLTYIEKKGVASKSEPTRIVVGNILK